MGMTSSLEPGVKDLFGAAKGLNAARAAGVDAELLAAWKEGRTGYPWIDACMTQLREEGWIHHLARHAVACFLTRGDLWQSWEKGAEVFDELLLDAQLQMQKNHPRNQYQAPFSP